MRLATREESCGRPMTMATSTRSEEVSGSRSLNVSCTERSGYWAANSDTSGAICRRARPMLEVMRSTP